MVVVVVAPAAVTAVLVELAGEVGVLPAVVQGVEDRHAVHRQGDGPAVERGLPRDRLLREPRMERDLPRVAARVGLGQRHLLLPRPDADHHRVVRQAVRPDVQPVVVVAQLESGLERLEVPLDGRDLLLVVGGKGERGHAQRSHSREQGDRGPGRRRTPREQQGAGREERQHPDAQGLVGQGVPVRPVGSRPRDGIASSPASVGIPVHVRGRGCRVPVVGHRRSRADEQQEKGREGGEQDAHGVPRGAGAGSCAGGGRGRRRDHLVAVGTRYENATFPFSAGPAFDERTSSTVAASGATRTRTCPGLERKSPDR